MLLCLFCSGRVFVIVQHAAIQCPIEWQFISICLQPLTLTEPLQTDMSDVVYLTIAVNTIPGIVQF